MARRSPNSNRPRRPSSTPAKRKGIPLTPLAQKMLQDLQLAGKAERTQESYLRRTQVRTVANKSPIKPRRTICDATCCSSRTTSSGKAPSRSPTPDSSSSTATPARGNGPALTKLRVPKQSAAHGVDHPRVDQLFQ